MKKILFTLALLLMSLQGFAKGYIFTLQKDYTFKTSDDKSYYVEEKPGKTAQELYKETLVAISGMFNSPKDVVSQVDGETITALCVIPDIYKNVMGFHMDVKMKFSFRFKDGKIRVDAPELIQVYGPKGTLANFNLKAYGVFNPTKDFYKEFHSAINGIATCFNQKIVDEDW